MCNAYNRLRAGLTVAERTTLEAEYSVVLTFVKWIAIVDIQSKGITEFSQTLECNFTHKLLICFILVDPDLQETNSTNSRVHRCSAVVIGNQNGNDAMNRTNPSDSLKSLRRSTTTGLRGRTF
jgi:hypothetical protein